MDIDIVHVLPVIYKVNTRLYIYKRCFLRNSDSNRELLSGEAV